MSVIPGTHWGVQCAGCVCLAAAGQAIHCVNDRTARLGGWEVRGRFEEGAMVITFLADSDNSDWQHHSSRLACDRPRILHLVQARGALRGPAGSICNGCLICTFFFFFFEILSSLLLIRPRFIPGPLRVKCSPIQTLWTVSKGVFPSQTLPINSLLHLHNRWGIVVLRGTLTSPSNSYFSTVYTRITLLQ